VQSCVDQANKEVQNELQTFSGYAGTNLIGRVALGAFSGAISSFWRFYKTGNPWIAATGATVGAASGLVFNMYFDSQAIQKIENSFMDKFARCMEKTYVPKLPE
jgi:hypothetical protein